MTAKKNNYKITIVEVRGMRNESELWSQDFQEQSIYKKCRFDIDRPPPSLEAQ